LMMSTVPYFLSFDAPSKEPPRWLYVSPIESDGSGLPSMLP
jgi:hypothetical protein